MKTCLTQIILSFSQIIIFFHSFFEINLRLGWEGQKSLQLRPGSHREQIFCLKQKAKYCSCILSWHLPNIPHVIYYKDCTHRVVQCRSDNFFIIIISYSTVFIIFTRKAVLNKVHKVRPNRKKNVLFTQLHIYTFRLFNNKSL